MKSKWSHLKPEAIRLRKLGKSLPYVHQKLGIPKSTLSYWFKDIELTPEQKEKLHENWKNALGKARKEAVKWHNAQKTERLSQAKQAASETLDRLDTENSDVLELALAILYLGEGSKKKVETGLGSSDPKILLFYLKALTKLYDVEISTLRCQLHLRADQDEETMKKYWSDTLNIPITCFKYVHHDQRTAGKATYSDYKGVCSITGGSVAIQRKLMYLAYDFVDIICKQK
tara:strand:- start:2727 stop:3416 length:690 start_codon:yes stop_codon:yes gene_type:complete